MLLLVIPLYSIAAVGVIMAGVMQSFYGNSMQTLWCSGSTDTIHCFCVNTQVQMGEREVRGLLAFLVSIISYIPT